MNVQDTQTIANAVGIGIAIFLIGANASPDRARGLLGKRLEKYAEIGDAELSRAVRGTYWGFVASPERRTGATPSGRPRRLQTLTALTAAGSAS